MKHVCSGGVTHFALAPDEEEGGIMTIAWGQNAANGELGLGPEEPKSATKPTRNQPLIGIDVFESVSSTPRREYVLMPDVVSSRVKTRHFSSSPRMRNTLTCHDTQLNWTHQTTV
jgi:hypothetical protein